MTLTGGELWKQIQDHPKSKAGRAYKLGLQAGKPAIDKASALIEDQEKRIRELEGKLYAAPPADKGGTLTIWWVGGDSTKIKLARTVPIQNLTGDGKFLAIPEQENSRHGDIINLSHVLMLLSH